MQKIKIRLLFQVEMLGTTPLDKEIYTNFIASKSENATDDESESIVEERGCTGFHTTTDGCPFLYDYMIKGFFKDACGMMRKVKNSKSSKLSAYKKAIDGLLFVSPRKIVIDTKNLSTGWLERPLRASTPKGERVSLAKSQTAPAGSEIEFEVMLLGEIDESLLAEWLDYGSLRGIGQWRNAGYGRFSYEII